MKCWTVMACKYTIVAPTLNSPGIMCPILGCFAFEMKIPTKDGSVPSYFHREDF